MPPLCAPTPPDLRSSSATSNRALTGAAEQQQMLAHGTAGDGDDERSRMVAALVTALNDAATAAAIGAESDDRDDPVRRDQLAREAYTSLCFDFPIVPTNALAALASIFRSTPLAFGSSSFPLSERFTSGLRYLVAVEITNPGGPVVESFSTEGARGNAGEEDRKKHILELFGRAFLLAPATSLALAQNDNGASLHELLATYSLPAEDLGQAEEARPDGAHEDGGSAESVSASEVEAETSDDDSDWESLETFTSSSDAAVSRGSPLVTDQNVSPSSLSWPILMSKLVNIAESFSPEVISAKLWDELQITDRILKAFQTLKWLDKKGVNVEPAAELYAQLLSEYLLLSWNTSSSEVSRVVPALTELAWASREEQKRSTSARPTTCSMQWDNLVLKTVAKLCNFVGRFQPGRTSLTPRTTRSEPAGMTASFNDGPKPAFVRNLWQSVYSNLHYLQEQLVVVSGKPAYSQLEEILWILCYMLRYAPGNINLQTTLLEGGLFRIALQLFVNMGRGSTMDSLRHFLLLSMASCSAVAEFAAQVPSFTASVTATDLHDQRSADAYATVLRLLLRAACGQTSGSGKSKSPQEDRFKANEAELFVASVFANVVDGVDKYSSHITSPHFLKELNWVHRLLSLLEEAVSCTSRSIFKLWQSGGPIDKNGSRLQAALGSLLVLLSETVQLPSPKSKPHEKDREDYESGMALPSVDDRVVDASTSKLASRDPEEEMSPHASSDSEALAMKREVKELLPSIILQLKVLSGPNKGFRESKID